MSTKSDQNQDYFSILKCNKSATYEELKQNYQELIRKCHPDKHGGSEEDFITIDKAWKTLRDEELRKQYIHLKEQEELESQGFIHEEILKSQLRFDDKNVINHPCRCGSSFVICKEYLIEEEFIIECEECTNCIVVK